jgi:murein L,D-transpeptidase YafK
MAGLAIAMSEPLITDRAADARERTLPTIKAKFKERKISFPPQALVLRAFKSEAELELWSGGKWLKTYPIVRMSGVLGPKRREGDLQVPEGLYYINRFNPKSRFHLSLGLNYPNAADRILGDASRPGGDIFIHGSNVSIGCLAMGDDQIEEIYTIARAAAGRVQVLVLPGRNHVAKTALDRQLVRIDTFFRKHHRLPVVRVDASGNYVLPESKDRK